MRTTLLAALAALGTTLVVLLGVGLPANGSATRAPAPDTIVDVTGDAANGFEISVYDGSGLYPPTDSEALAECSEYDKRVDRVRCRVEVKTWYRDLADLKQALDWAHAS